MEKHNKGNPLAFSDHPFIVAQIEVKDRLAITDTSDIDVCIGYCPATLAENQTKNTVDYLPMK